MRYSFPATPPRFLAALLALLLLAGLAACKSTPPREPGIYRDPDLAELIKLDPTIRPDIRYATPNNFTGHPLYDQARAFLQKPAAEALARANQALRAEGYGILVYDAYRPWSVTKEIWDSANDTERRIGFVANPRVGSKHNRGCAVDVGLYDLETGLEVKMPSGYDEFSERAHPNYAASAPGEIKARDLLRRTMEAEGFTVDPNEWWHFNYKDWREYRLMDIGFKDLAR